MHLSEMIKLAHANGVAKGFWGASENIPERLALIHSEVSQALNAYQDQESNGRIAEELAEVMIQVADLAGFMRLNLEEVILAKMAID